MFDFDISCFDGGSPACTRAILDVYYEAGQIVSDNLILTRRIKVNVKVTNLVINLMGNYAFQLTFIIKLLLIAPSHIMRIFHFKQ